MRLRQAKPIVKPAEGRRTRSLDALLPTLYLRGISTGDFQEALSALLGQDAPNLSPSAIGRLWASGRPKGRGLSVAPKIAVDGGALGFWKALDEVFPGTRHQRSWLHQVMNVLDKVPKSVEGRMKADLREISAVPTRAAAEKAITFFIEKYGAKHPSAVACLTKDRDTPLAFFDLPAEH